MSSVRIDNLDYNTNVIHDVNKNIIVESFLSGKIPEITDLKERLEILLVKCFSFTSKRCNYDELTGRYSSEDDMLWSVLKGSDAISNHHCAGSILHNKSSKGYLKYLEIMFWNKYKVITTHTLKKRDINILRSNGIKDKGHIENPAMRWSKTHNEFIIKVSMENNTLEKHIVLRKIIELNPEIEIEVSLPIINDLPDWVNKEYLEWKKFIHLNSKHIKIIEE